ncbi:hypothetical protein CYY_001011 [Polysphondylium violaceum]|uniref:Peptidase M3A and M3B domain-containing protein n=1 Tax=Polysphondylium violaceum TaxID=133409 RepID=A0A8J4Q2U0_9MYCE|nr:hypothetical protein CYY_001011 [Polysphondylium violaceum]
MMISTPKIYTSFRYLVSSSSSSLSLLKRNYISTTKFGNNNKITKCGLFGIDELKSPLGWEKLYEKHVDIINRNLDTLSRNKITHKSSLKDLVGAIYLMDEISRSVCSVMDPAELCRSVHPDQTFKLAAHQIYQDMFITVNKLNTNKEMYLNMVALQNHGEFNNLRDDYKIFVNEMVKESEINGIHLEPSVRDKVNVLKEKIHESGIQYIQEIQNFDSDLDNLEYLKVPGQLLQGLPKYYYNTIPPADKNGNYLLNTSSFMVNGVTRFCNNKNVRRELYQLQCNSKANQSLVNYSNQFLHDRQALAELLGFPSYSHFELRTKLIKTPENAIGFLNNLTKENENGLEKEMDLIKEIKNRDPTMLNEPINEWDLLYFKSKLSEQVGDSANDLAEYLSFENVLNGFNSIVQRLFGIQCKRIPVEEGEVWHQDVVKLELYNKSEGVIGHFYLDLFERKEKPMGNINFCIGLGFKKSMYLDPANVPKHNPEQLNLSEYEVPKVAIVCNFADKRNHTLNLPEYEILLHEFGHTLHSLLSRGDFQHLCGTRGPTDFVEIPSTLMEHFATNHSVLKEFAFNQAGRSLPLAGLNEFKRVHSQTKSLQLGDQIIMSFLDLYAHGNPPTDINLGLMNQKLKKDIMGVYDLASPNLLRTFAHLYHYGSYYYSYLLSKHYSQMIWTNHFNSGNSINFDRVSLVSQICDFEGSMIDCSKTLFELEADSLQAVEIFVKLQDTYGKEKVSILDVQTLTINQLADKLDKP